MRRLPVYLILDTSASMYGKPIEAVNKGLQVLVSTLRQDPYALETAYLSIITFNTKAKQIVPLSDLISFQIPPIEVQGMTALGEALSLAADCIKKEVVKTTQSQRGDWRPLVFLMTDGSPNDDWEKGFQRFKELKLSMVIGCAAGADANLEVLKKIANVVVQLDTADEATIKAFFKWVSASVSTSSHKVDLTKKDVAGIDDLPPPPSEINIVI